MESERRFSTAEVAEQVGVHRDTLLRWLREGRVAEPGRDRNGWRTFTSDDVGNIQRFAGAEQESTASPVYSLRRAPTPTVRETFTPIDPIERLRSLDWDFVGAKTNYLTHGLHPYPAKFIPQIPNALIQELSSVGEVVADIFCGSGTTLVEALTLKRHAVGVDANPLACLITEAKTTPLEAEELTTLRQLVLNSAVLSEQVADATQQGRLFAPNQPLHGVVPEGKAIQFWFEPFVVDELAQIRSWAEAIGSPAARTLARVALSSIIVAVSRQDSDTRYVRRQKNLVPGDVLKRFSKALEDAVREAAELTELLEPRFSRRVINASVLDSPEVGDIDLVVSSPPYPNAYSYHLYHMTRMLWLGMDQPTFKRAEIGSHRKYSAKGPRAATHKTFAGEMDRIFAWLATRLKAGRFACFVVGDSIIGGRRYNNADTMAIGAADYGFTEVARIERRLQDTKKAFNPVIGKIRQEHILILQNRGDSS
ncbi:MAG: DNA methyltransferase [Steroidobacteraceae bacterium]